MATFWLIMAFIKVDLPVFGLPTITTLPNLILLSIVFRIPHILSDFAIRLTF
jgi:hypothetical protein